MDKTAFLMGYWDGKKKRSHMSRKQAEKYLRGLPESAITAYLNGRDDAVNGDDTRYQMMRETAQA